jgi:hypothetical protein
MLKMIGILMILGCLPLAGCATFGKRDQPPACDGGDKRPANAGKWNGAMSFGCEGEPK